jgi:hypothetical protein
MHGHQDMKEKTASGKFATIMFPDTFVQQDQFPFKRIQVRMRVTQ